MKIIFASGGTAGHINPAIAIADRLKREYKDIEILFIGNPYRMESVLVPKAGYAFVGVVVEGFHRSFAPRSIIHNLKAVYYMLTAGSKVAKIINEFKPDIVMGTGGYVSGPVLRTSARLGYKTITHESNAFPGVTTKLLIDHVDKVLLATGDSKKYLPESNKYIITGNPVRPSILETSKKTARKKLGIPDNLFCILSYGGSGGAEAINLAMAEVIAALLKNNDTYHIHATGKRDWTLFTNKLDELEIPLNHPRLYIKEYLDNMDLCLAAADLVICRSGAMTTSELQAIGRASILIPSPYVAENHQYHNAMTMVRRNAAILIEQDSLTSEKLYNIIVELIDDPLELSNIAHNANNMFTSDSLDIICNEIFRLLEDN